MEFLLWHWLQRNFIVKVRQLSVPYSMLKTIFNPTNHPLSQKNLSYETSNECTDIYSHTTNYWNETSVLVSITKLPSSGGGRVSKNFLSVTHLTNFNIYLQSSENLGPTVFYMGLVCAVTNFKISSALSVILSIAVTTIFFT